MDRYAKKVLLVYSFSQTKGCCALYLFRWRRWLASGWAQDFTATDTSGPDATQAAQALHVAVAELRLKNISFMRWSRLFIWGGDFSKDIVTLLSATKSVCI
jgi:hypothetical protein